MDDILQRIVERRRQDLEQKGPTLGYSVPPERQRPVNPFLPEGGVILEIKRASPSRGIIASDLDAVHTAKTYIEAGAAAISILTEEHYFKGSLQDLLEVGKAFPYQPLLRKDFILTGEDIAVSYRAGADGVLLIARLFDEHLLLHLAEEAVTLGMCPLIEVREEEDLPKLRFVAERVPCRAGVNSRDLRTFTIDPLLPALRIAELPVPAIYESGVQTPFQASYAAHLGYTGILIGEGAVRQKEQISLLIHRFMHTKKQLQNPSGPADEVSKKGDLQVSAQGFWQKAENRSFPPSFPTAGELWRRLAQRRAYRQRHMRGETSRSWCLGAPPLIKICGLTRLEDVQQCLTLGADLLGFIFAPSPRQTHAELVRQARFILTSLYSPSFEVTAPTPVIPPPLFIGVITDAQSPMAHEAFRLVREGFLDGIQYHGPLDEEALARFPEEIGRYVVLPVSHPADKKVYQFLQKRGEVRILLDRRVGNQNGGTGLPIQYDILEALREPHADPRSSFSPPLWIAGGLAADTVASLLSRYPVELVDASSRLEIEPGKKDPEKLRAFFAAILHPESTKKEEVSATTSHQHKEYHHG